MGKRAPSQRNVKWFERSRLSGSVLVVLPPPSARVRLTSLAVANYKVQGAQKTEARCRGIPFVALGPFPPLPRPFSPFLLL